MEEKKLSEAEIKKRDKEERIKKQIREIVKEFPEPLEAYPRMKFEEQLSNFLFSKLKEIKEINESES